MSGKLYNRNKEPLLSLDIRKIRNIINSTIEKAKSYYVRNILGTTKKDPKTLSDPLWEKQTYSRGE